MCFSSTPKPPAIRKEPQRGDAARNAANDMRLRSSTQQGDYGNIFTSTLGDVGYGQNAVKQVKLGGVSAAA